jgi:hypothetical protein
MVLYSAVQDTEEAVCYGGTVNCQVQVPGTVLTRGALEYYSTVPVQLPYILVVV